MEIDIQCQARDSLPLDVLEEFQGNLKKRLPFPRFGCKIISVKHCAVKQQLRDSYVKS